MAGRRFRRRLCGWRFGCDRELDPTHDDETVMNGAPKWFRGLWFWAREMVDDACVDIGRAGTRAGVRPSTRGGAYFQGSEIDGTGEADIEAESELHGAAGFSLRLERIAAG